MDAITEPTNRTNHSIQLARLSPAQHSDTSFYLFEEKDTTYLVKLYLHEHGEEASLREKRGLLHWRAHGFFVPGVYHRVLPQLKNPHVVMDYIQTETLADFISRHTSKAEIYPRIRQILQSNAARHRLSLQRSDASLIHSDLHPDNILIDAESFYYIDFATPHKDKSVLELVSLEVERFMIQLLRVMGKESMPSLTELLVAAYSGQEAVLTRIVEKHDLHPCIRMVKSIRESLRRDAQIRRYQLADVFKKTMNYSN